MKAAALALAVVLLGGGAGWASPIHDVADSIDLSPIQGFVDEVNRSMARYGRPLSWEDVLTVFSGEMAFRPGELLGLLAAFFLGEVRLNMALLGQLVALGILAALLENLHGSLGGVAVGKVAGMVLCLVLVVLGLASLSAGLGIAARTVDTLVGFMLALLPALVALLAGVGALTSAAIFHPLLVAVVHIVGVVVADWVFPLLFLGSVAGVMGFLAPEFRVDRLAGLVRQVGLTVLGVCFSVFLGVVTVQGAAGAVADGVTLRTAKFLAKSAVPVVGGMFADAAEMVIGSALLLKNAVGLLGLAVVAGLAVFPLLRLVGLVLVYRAAAAVVEPLGGERAAGIMSGLAGGLSTVTLAVGVISLMFLTALTSMLAAANVAVMMR